MARYSLFAFRHAIFAFCFSLFTFCYSPFAFCCHLSENIKSCIAFIIVCVATTYAICDRSAGLRARKTPKKFSFVGLGGPTSYLWLQILVDKMTSRQMVNNNFLTRK